MNSKSNPNSGLKLHIYCAACWCIMANVVAPSSLASGLSDEVVVNKQWRDLESSTSLSINPSFPAFTERPTFSSAMASTQWGSFVLVNSQVTIPVTSSMKLSQTLGISLTGFSSGEMEYTNWERGKIVVKDEGISYSELYGTIGYSLRPIDNLTAGVNFNLARQSNFGNPVYDGAFDIGASYHLENAYVGSHLFGICLLNPAGISRFKKPVYTADVGVSWSMLSPQITDDISLRGGIDANYRSFTGDNYGSPRKDVAARIGVTIRNMLTCYVQVAKYYVGISAKIELDSARAPLALQFRNANESGNDDKHFQMTQFHKASAGYQILKTQKQFRPTNTLYLSTEFGKVRDEGDNCFETYNKAQKQYSSCNFWEAYGYYSIIERDCPDFLKIDEVKMRAAHCLEQLEQERLAIDKYKNLKETYRFRTTYNDAFIIGGADLGLYRLLSKDDDSALADEHYARFMCSPAADTLKTTGRYLYGMAKMRHDNGLAALEAFDGITDTTHPVFPFAAYAKGVYYAGTDKMASATEAFDAVVLFEKKYRTRFTGCSETDALDELIYRARFALGVRNYEQFREQAYKLRVCDSIRNDVVTALGTALNSVDDRRSGYSLVCPQNDSGVAITQDSVIVRASVRTLLHALAGAIGGMDYLEIGSAFQIGSDSLTINMGELASNVTNGGNELLTALKRTTGSAVTADRNCALWLTDTTSRLRIVFEQLNLKAGNDTLITGCKRCRLTIRNAPAWTRNSVEDVLSVSKKYAALLEQTKSALQGIPETSRWGADVLYLAAWVFYQMKNWKACEVVIDLLEDRAAKRVYRDVQPYMMADLNLMKTVIMRKVDGGILDRKSAELKRIELSESADSIMTSWLSALHITRHRIVTTAKGALTASDSAANAQVDAQNELKIDSLLDHPQVFRKILQDSIAAAIAYDEQKRLARAKNITMLIARFDDDLFKKENGDFVNKGKLIEAMVYKYRDEVCHERDTITEILADIADYEHQRAYGDLILGIIGDIKKSNYASRNSRVDLTPTVAEPLPAASATSKPVPVPEVMQPAAPIESDMEKLRRENEELRRLLMQRQPAVQEAPAK